VKKKIKIASIFGALYLGILPLLFFVHAFEHQHQSNNTFHIHYNDEGKVLNADETDCNLCDLFFNQDTLKELAFDFKAYNTYKLPRVCYYDAFLTPTALILSLRAPPQKFSGISRQSLLLC